jgi:hypothetical protein
VAVSGAGGHDVRAGLLLRQLPEPGELGNLLMLHSHYRLLCFNFSSFCRLFFYIQKVDASEN